MKTTAELNSYLSRDAEFGAGIQRIASMSIAEVHTELRRFGQSPTVQIPEELKRLIAKSSKSSRRMNVTTMVASVRSLASKLVLPTCQLSPGRGAVVFVLVALFTLLTPISTRTFDKWQKGEITAAMNGSSSLLNPQTVASRGRVDPQITGAQVTRKTLRRTSAAGGLGTTVQQGTSESPPIIGTYGRVPLELNLQPVVGLRSLPIGKLSVGNQGEAVGSHGSRDRSFDLKFDRKGSGSPERPEQRLERASSKEIRGRGLNNTDSNGSYADRLEHDAGSRERARVEAALDRMQEAQRERAVNDARGNDRERSVRTSAGNETRERRAREPLEKKEASDKVRERPTREERRDRVPGL